MNRTLFAGVFSLLASGAFALDATVGGTSEFYANPLTDHGPGTSAGMVGPGHDHGNDTIKNFVEHAHEGRLADRPPDQTDRSNRGNILHDHGNETFRNFTPHEHD